jgi:hypothetical protein
MPEKLGWANWLSSRQRLAATGIVADQLYRVPFRVFHVFFANESPAMFTLKNRPPGLVVH